MKKSFVNNVTVCGYVFSIEDNARSWNNLQKSVTGEKSKTPGIEYIRGTVNIATDDEGLNVVPVSFTYVTATTKSGNVNGTFTFLNNLLNEQKNGTLRTFENSGTDAEKICVSGNIDLNEWFNGEGELVSAKIVRGGFARSPRLGEEMGATFEAECLFSGCSRQELEDTEYETLSGYAFNFRNELLPVNFTVRDKGGMDYFEDQEISSKNPLLTKVWGEIVSNVVKTEQKVESAFGASQVKATSRTFRAWDVTGASAGPMEFDDEETITKNELKSALQNRETYVAKMKQEQEERQAGKKSAFGAKKEAVKKVEEDDEDFAF